MWDSQPVQSYDVKSNDNLTTVSPGIRLMVMKVRTNTPGKVFVQSVVVYDPWPFSENEVMLSRASLYEHDRISSPDDECYSIIRGEEDTLAELSDGRLVVLRQDDLDKLDALLARS